LVFGRLIAWEIGDEELKESIEDKAGTE